MEDDFRASESGLEADSSRTGAFEENEAGSKTEFAEAACGYGLSDAGGESSTGDNRVSASGRLDGAIKSRCGLYFAGGVAVGCVGPGLPVATTATPFRMYTGPR